MSFKNRTAIVTGASRGIGRAIAMALGSNGANVVVNYLQSKDAAEETAKSIRDAGGRSEIFQTDVRNFEQVKQMVSFCVEKFGSPDILVNNAGILRDNPIAFTGEEEWDSVVDTSLKGAFFCIKAVGKEMMRKKYGRIISISSDAGLMGDLMRSSYSSAKAGITGLTRTAARELAASGITVNAVSPGYIDTDMTAATPEAKKNRSIERIPLSRFGKPEEVAGVVLFLASDAAAYITGHVLCVDGGLHM